jgi:hypothetical protein
MIAGVIVFLGILAVLAGAAYQPSMSIPWPGLAPHGPSSDRSTGGTTDATAGDPTAGDPTAGGSQPGVASQAEPSAGRTPAPSGPEPSSAGPGLPVAAPAPPGSATAAVELLANQGFESGLTAWTCAGNAGRIASTPVRSGRYALAADTGPGKTARCVQAVEVRPGQRYTLSAWMCGDEPVLGVGGSGLASQEVGAPGAGSYTKILLTFVAPPGTTSVSVWLRGSHGIGTYYADDVSLM